MSANILYLQMTVLLDSQKFYDAIECGLEAQKQLFLCINPEELKDQQVHLIQQQELELDIINQLANIYLELNDPTKAVGYLIRVIAIEYQQNKKNMQNLGGAFAKVGKACFYSCQYDYSEFFLKLAKKILEDNNHGETNEMALTLTQLGNYHRFMFHDEEADSALKMSVEIRIKLYGVQSVEVAESLHSLAQLYTDMGLLEKSIDIIDQAISILETILGRQHIKTAKSIYLKGNLCLRSKPLDLLLAEKLITESLNINKNVVGERFLETADCYHSLGKIKSQNMQSQEYETYFQKALGILEDIYGNNHACIAILLNNLGRAYYDRKQYEDAEQCFSRSIHIYSQICGNAHGNLAITLKSSADCHKHLGRFKEAHSEYQLSLRIYEKIETDFSLTKQQIKKLLTETETED